MIAVSQAPNLQCACTCMHMCGIRNFCANGCTCTWAHAHARTLKVWFLGNSYHRTAKRVPTERLLCSKLVSYQKLTLTLFFCKKNLILSNKKLKTKNLQIFFEKCESAVCMRAQKIDCRCVRRTLRILAKKSAH